MPSRAGAGVFYYIYITILIIPHSARLRKGRGGFFRAAQKQKRPPPKGRRPDGYSPSLFIALPSGLLIAVSTAASAKLSTRYTGNIAGSGRPLRCTSGKKAIVSST